MTNKKNKKTAAPKKVSERPSSNPIKEAPAVIATETVAADVSSANKIAIDAVGGVDVDSILGEELDESKDLDQKVAEVLPVSTDMEVPTIIPEEITISNTPNKSVVNVNGSVEIDGVALSSLDVSSSTPTSSRFGLATSSCKSHNPFFSC